MISLIRRIFEFEYISFYIDNSIFLSLYLKFTINTI